MWPYIIRLNTRALLILTLFFGSVIVLWFYLLVGSKDHLTNSGLSVANVDLKKLLIAGVIASIRGGQEVVKVRKSNYLKESSKGKTREGVNDVLTLGDLSSHRVMVEALSATFPRLRIISEEHFNSEDNNLDIIPIDLNKELVSDEQLSALPIGLEVPLDELTVWVDPLDATKEYSEGLTQYVTTMVCIARNGEPIIGVIHKPFSVETYWAWNTKGMSNNIINSINNRKTNDTFRAIVSRSHSGNVEQLIRSSLSDKYKQIEVISAAGSGYKTIELIEGKVDAYIHVTLIKKWDICAPNAILNSINNAKMTTFNGQTISYRFEEEVTNEDGLVASIGSDPGDHDKLLTLLKHSKQ